MLKTIKKYLFDRSSGCYQEIVELVLRVALGSFMLTHGCMKLSSFSEKAEMFPDPIGVGPVFSMMLVIFAEFFCAIFLTLGLITRFAALNLLITMLVAGFIVHSNDPFSKKELALLYAVGFLYFMICGGNKYSLDQWIRKQIK